MRPYILNYMMDLKFLRLVVAVIDKHNCHAKHTLTWIKYILNLTMFLSRNRGKYDSWSHKDAVLML